MLSLTLASVALAAATPQIVPADRMAAYRAAIPHVSSVDVERVLQSPETFWYDAASIVSSYQDTVGDGSGFPIGARANSKGKPIIVAEGKKFFSATGEHWSFPYGHTAGMDDSDNAVIANFLSLPVQDGARLPVVYKTIDDNGWRGIGLHRWLWQFPVGTVIGELVMIKDSAGSLFPVEIRSRTKGEDGWAIDAFRPFPTASSLINAIKAQRPDWAGTPSLAALVAHLEDETTLTDKRVTSPGFNGIVTLEGSMDVLPDFGDDTLVKTLLTTTRFMSSIGAVWKADGERLSYAPSTNSPVSIVPRRSFHGLIEVSNESCSRCHGQTSKMLLDFESQTILYGDLWGQDQIFSFHPWDPSRYYIFNSENRQVRPELIPMVQRYDASRHRAPTYDPF